MADEKQERKTEEERFAFLRHELSETMMNTPPSTAYAFGEDWETARRKPWAKELHTFGSRQNQINLSFHARIRSLEIDNHIMAIELQRHQDEMHAIVEREKKIFGRIAAEMDSMQAEINRLRLTVQLNTNAIDRILKGETDIQIVTESGESPVVENPTTPTEEEQDTQN